MRASEWKEWKREKGEREKRERWKRDDNAGTRRMGYLFVTKQLPSFPMRAEQEEREGRRGRWVPPHLKSPAPLPHIPPSRCKQSGSGCSTINIRCVSLRDWLNKGEVWGKNGVQSSLPPSLRRRLCQPIEPFNLDTEACRDHTHLALTNSNN